MSEGAYLMEKIRSRCVEEGECLLWQGTLAAGCAPSIRFQGAMVSIRRWLWVQMGRKLVDGGAIKVKCRNVRCVAEACLIAGKRGSAVGEKRLMSTRIKVSRLKRAMSALSMDDIRAIRISDESAKELAARYGKWPDFINDVKAGRRWNPELDGPTPFQGLGGNR